MTVQTLTPLTIDQAYYARDALAKAVYTQLFTWLVGEINAKILRKVRILSSKS